MGRFDYISEYNADEKYTLHMLYKQLALENDPELSKLSDANTTYKDNIYIESYKDKINGSKAGIIKRLKNTLSFDIVGLSKGSNYETFRMLQVLKILYYFETKERCSFTNLIGSPHLENIDNEYAKASKNGDLFYKIFSEATKLVSDTNDRNTIFFKTNYELEQLIGSFRLNVINGLLTKELLIEIDKEINELFDIFCSEKSKLSKSYEGVAESFVNILICHKLIANDTDKIHMNSCYEELEEPSEAYIEKFYSVDNSVDNVIIADIEAWIGDRNSIIDKDFSKQIWDIITYFEYDEKDLKHYRFAINHYKKVLEWIFQSVKYNNPTSEGDTYDPYTEPINRNIIREYKERGINSKDIAECVTLDIIITVIQELIYIDKNRIKFENRFFRYNKVYNTLTSSVKDNNDANEQAAVIRFLIRRIENRAALNRGLYQNFKLYREIESKMYQIKIAVYNCKDIVDFYTAEYLFYNSLKQMLLGRYIRFDHPIIDRDVYSGFKKIDKMIDNYLKEVEDATHYEVVWLKNHLLRYWMIKQGGKLSFLGEYIGFKAKTELDDFKTLIIKAISEINDSVTQQNKKPKNIIITSDDGTLSCAITIDPSLKKIIILDVFSQLPSNITGKIRELGIDGLIGGFFKDFS